MNILIGGTVRTGSTRLFNLVRLLAYQNYDKDDIRTGRWNYNWTGKKNINICKSHECTEKWYEWADFIFVSTRNWMDIAASSIEFMNSVNRDLEKNRVFFESIAIPYFHTWHNKADYVLPYETFEESKHTHIKNIANLLNFKICDDQKIVETLEKYKNKEIIDHESLIFHYHISPNSHKTAKERMSENEYKFFENIFKKHNLSY